MFEILFLPRGIQLVDLFGEQRGEEKRGEGKREISVPKILTRVRYGFCCKASRIEISCTDSIRPTPTACTRVKARA
jgi:hypothetical protein